ncbi:type 1 glutamine amidotransferase [Chitinimonas arctica]|uniref:Type 1 glutamine amidotransferase n=1 Tax=Chitinimonas arctica TaxID=2594795 RepID=A0A516SHU8_9NEIS|nr:type 1 glutamine amidotransferase [Chitinimonas arctica]QDQ27732.1 type 1 glutamine amidotransferase [Chitinimonas arctica]
MFPIALIQHVADDGPGYLLPYLNRIGRPCQVFKMFEGARLPHAIDGYAGLVVLGGPMSANDDIGYFPPLLALIRAAIAADIPVLGHCLGAQLMSLALGGTVQAAEHVEIGWCDLRLEDSAARWFGAVETVRQFQWHGESFSIPAGAIRIASGDYCANQAFVVNGLHLGLQFHSEVDEFKVKRWLELGQEELSQCASPAVQQEAALLPGLAEAIVASQRVADTIYGEWVKGLR